MYHVIRYFLEGNLDFKFDKTLHEKYIGLYNTK